MPPKQWLAYWLALLGSVQAAFAAPIDRAAVVELPLDNLYVGVAAMYRSMFYRQPLVNGYSGHFPPHYIVLSQSLSRLDSSGLLYFARRRPLIIVVNDNQDPGNRQRRMIESIPAIQSWGITAGGSTFVLPAQAEPRMPPVGAAIDAQVKDSGRLQLEYDLGEPRNLAAIDIALGRRYDDFASHLQIEVSLDGREWRDAWTGWTGGLAVEATLADPTHAPIRIPIPGERARYVRIYPASEWMRTGVVVRSSK